MVHVLLRVDGHCADTHLCTRPEHPDSNLTSLLILDRQTGKELLKKEYTDGVIYEYMDFSRFNTPLGQITVLIKGSGGQVLKELTPVIRS